MRDEPEAGFTVAKLRANLEPTRGVGRLRQQDGGHGSRNPLRSVLPTLESTQSEVGSSGWKSTARRAVSGAPPAALENPERPSASHAAVVLITASGLQGEQPLVDGTMLGKGSRQNGSVTSGKGLALRAGHGGPSPEPVGCRRTARAASAAESGSPRAGRGTDWERPSSGGLPRASNSQLRTGTDKGIRLFN
ncbi:hypothetical protein L6452_45699 [Arctium lappa]|nr:hypothetical protein L6452_45699 [Arctium lappa]